MKNIIKKLSHFLPDRMYIYLKYWLRLKKIPNLTKPKTYNEKLQWLKLYDRKEIYTIMVDKFEVKKYVSSIIGIEYIIPTLGVWTKFDDINFNDLPNQFVLKCTHDSGGLVICKDKKNFDINKAKEKIEASLKENYFWQGREWPYKNVRPRIIAEKYIEDKLTKELRDYKFYTFNGKVQAVMVNSDRGNVTKADYFDKDYKHLGFRWGYENALQPPRCPYNFTKMIELAEILAKDTYTLRVDFYEVNKKLYFGELTFFDGSGMQSFEPSEWDEKFGDWLVLPEE